MLSRIPLVLLLPIVVCLMAADWETLTTPTGKFTVAFPGKPTKMEDKVDGHLMTTWSLEQNDRAYFVISATVPLPDNATAEMIDKILDDTRKNPHGKILSSMKIKVQGKYPGRERVVEINDPRGYLRQRLFLVDKVLYQVLVGARDKDFLNSKDANRFLESFKLEIDWETFTPANGKCTVLFPGKPTETLEKTADGPPLKTWHVEDKDVAYVVITATLPDVPEDATAEMLDKRLDSIGKGEKGKILTIRKIKLDGKYPGREELIFNENKMYVRNRVFVAGKVMYQLFVIAPDRDFVTSKDADRFLDSFKLKK